MAESRRGLGRGLSALLDEVGAQELPATPEARAAAPVAAPAAGGALDVPIELIRRNPEQPRRSFAQAELDELAASVKEKGVIQPILVRPVEGVAGEYQIVAGERRWRAAQLAGLHTVPVLVRELSDAEVMEIALIENVQRADLNPIEEAQAYQAMALRFAHTQEALARIVGKSRSHVANTMRLLRLPAPVIEHLEAGRLSAGHARALLDVAGAETLAQRIVDQGLNVRQTEILARQAGEAAAPGKPAAARKPKAGKDADTRALEADLAEVLGLDVEIRDAGGAGELRIQYATLEQLDDLCRRLTRAAPPVGQG
ncbi:ParB/RepB/Spo0J family partition protein [Caulobacter sp. KR2-114]|uniref:ParB/RepB/Spo0J family partition protein n=1 Tax=Caulobacter sp. KR2-114 TaxID=3400912 RepID=UPI003C059FD4